MLYASRIPSVDKGFLFTKIIRQYGNIDPSGMASPPIKQNHPPGIFSNNVSCLSNSL